MGLKRVLNAGCGSKGNNLPVEFAAYKETRLDRNRAVLPDIVADIIAMPMVEDATFDAVICSHTLEHLYAHEVQTALKEFNRVLKPGGKLMVKVPDLQAIGGKLALDKAEETVYASPMGPICPLDIVYGHRGAVSVGNHFMAHKTGFTQSVLQRLLDSSEFVGVKIERGMQSFELTAWASKELVHESKEEETRLGGGALRNAGGAGGSHRDVPGNSLCEAGMSAAGGD